MEGSRRGRRRAGMLVAVAVALAVPATTAAGPAVLGLQPRDLGERVGQLLPIERVQASDSSRLARFEVRLGQLEEELRRLTGRIERLEYGQRNLESRLDQLIGDLDQRLRGLETGAAGAGPAPERPAPATTSSAIVPTPKPSETVVASQPASAPASAGDTATLGRVPQSALTNLPPRPDPAAVTPPESTSLSPQQQYDGAMDLLRAGDYAGAEGGLELFLELNPDDDLAANAAYWLAETHYVRQDYAAAAAAFARNYRTYGTGAAKAPDNLLKLGMSLQGLGESDKACRSYRELETTFPEAPVHIKQALVRERRHASCAQGAG